MKRVWVILFTVFFVLVHSCVSFGTDSGTKSEKTSIISFTSSHDWPLFDYTVFINGKDMGHFWQHGHLPGQGGSIDVTSGNYSIRVKSRFRMNSTGDQWHTQGYSDYINFELNDYEHITLYVNSRRLTIESRNKLPIPDHLKMKVNLTAIKNSFDSLSYDIPNGSTVAILNITPDNENNRFISEELRVMFVNSKKYRIVERERLESIRQEQRFQMSGDVSDDTAVGIGHFLGADVVISGTITGTGDQRRLRLRALNVKTAQILAMSSESI